MVPLIILFIISAVVVTVATRAVKSPKPLRLDADEVRLGEMYAKTLNLSLSGFVVTGSAQEGKIVLTTKRLIYTRYDEKRHALVLSRSEVADIAVTETGFLMKSPALRLTCMPVKRPKVTAWTLVAGVELVKCIYQQCKRPTVITWTAPKECVIYPELLLFWLPTRRFVNPHTVESFSRLLDEWKRGHARPDEKADGTNRSSQ